MLFEELDLLSVGHTTQLTGVIYSSGEESLLCFLPGEEIDLPTKVLEMSLEEWKKFIRQTDLLETAILERGVDGKLTKAILRKSTRQIEQGVSWNVFRRDNYACRYCGRDKVPLTVDHLLLWKDGGPSVEDNLVSCCRKCNKVRGDMEYSKWMLHPQYKRVSMALSADQRIANLLLVDSIQTIKLRPHKRSR